MRLTSPHTLSLPRTKQTSSRSATTSPFISNMSSKNDFMWLDWIQNGQTTTHTVDERPSNGQTQPMESTPLVQHRHPKRQKCKRLKKMVKLCVIGTLMAVVVVTSIVFAFHPESSEEPHFLVVSHGQPAVLSISDEHVYPYLFARVSGPFTQTGHVNHSVTIWIRDESQSRVLSSHTLYVKWPYRMDTLKGHLYMEDEPHKLTFETGEMTGKNKSWSFVVVSTEEQPIVLALAYHGSAASRQVAIICAGLILIFVYILIVFELVHRTVAAMIGSQMALMVLAVLNQRPTLETVVSWIDYQTICLLFGMMTIVAIFSGSGFFDYIALKSYKLAKGQVWPLITMLCLFSGIVSAFLDNVTTILLMTPVTIRLCQVLNLEPTNILIAEVLFSNIGGTATAVGDPPNVIIVSSRHIRSQNINFSVFTLHLSIGIVFCMISGYIMLRIMYRNLNLQNVDSQKVAELKHEAEVWRITANRVPAISAEESAVQELLLQKATAVEEEIDMLKLEHKKSGDDTWKEQLETLEQKYRITDKPLLIKSSVVLGSVILCFFTYSFVSNVHIEIGWIAVLGAVWLIVLTDVQKLEFLLEKIEWATLLFFAALFILMEALKELGLMQFIADHACDLIRKVPEQHQLLVAIIVILWVSAVASSFIDNIPFTTAMIPVVLNLGVDPDLNLSLSPLVWSLAMGACLGGNGTLIGASANVVCAGLAEQHGYRISFNHFFKFGFPMMIVTVFTAMTYLIICHAAIGWNGPT
ncbi:P protein-like [Corticium candelabrum]|uniref:P protein-like n=1 Tax=Corticium candelabrum TaxID=121492 RepID=UPI002E25714D|nr:P protein-like [Corticium candelabrum]